MKKYAIPLMAAVTVLSVVVAIFTYLRWAPSRAAVTVGGQKISKFDYQNAMELQVGPAVMKKLVYSDLIRQAATQQNVMPSTADVEARLADMTRRNTQLAASLQNSAVAAQTRDDLTTDLALENLRIKGVTASEPEIQSFYNTNRSAFTIPSQVQTTLVVSQNRTDASTAEHLLSLNTAPEMIARTPRLRVAGINGFNIDMSRLDPTTRTEIGKQVMGMRQGQMKTLPVGALFLTFKVKSNTPNITPPLSQVHEQVARLVRLKKAVSPQEELAALYTATTPTFINERYKNYFADIEQFAAQNAGKRKVASVP